MRLAPRAVQQPSNRLLRLRVSAKNTFDGGYGYGDGDSSRRRQNKKQRRINELNHVYYNVIETTGRELYEIMVDTLGTPYKMKLERRQGKSCLVVYAQSYVEMRECVKELEIIAQMVNETALKYFIRQLFKDIQVLEKNMFSEIVIPLDLYVADE